MKKVKGFVSQYVVIGCVLFLSIFTFASCGPTEDEDFQQLPVESETDEVAPPPTTRVDVETVNEPVELEAVTFKIDATSEESWAYFSFKNSNVVEVADAENSEEWDIGFQRTRVKLNGGTSGPGEGSVVMLTGTTFEAVTAAPAEGYLSDSADTLAIVPQSEKGWYIYTGPPTHWVLPLADRVFVVKAADGTFAKVRFVGYYKDNENKQDSGFVTFEYIHQSDGSPNF